MKKFIAAHMLALLAIAGFLPACQQHDANTRTTADSSLSKKPDGTLTYTDTLKDKQKDTAQASTIKVDQLIVPGKSIGLTRIDEDMKTLLQRLGKPDAGDNAMGKSMSFWYAGHDNSGYKTAVFAARQMVDDNDQGSKVKQILITSPYFQTADFVHTGVTYKQVVAKYKLKKVSVVGKQHQLTVYDTSAGIAFEFDVQNICKGIIVHALERQGGLIYLAFHPELE